MSLCACSSFKNWLTAGLGFLLRNFCKCNGRRITKSLIEILDWPATRYKPQYVHFNFGRNGDLRRLGHRRRRISVGCHGRRNRRRDGNRLSAERRRALSVSILGACVALEPASVRGLGGNCHSRCFFGGRCRAALWERRLGDGHRRQTLTHLVDCSTHVGVGVCRRS